MIWASLRPFQNCFQIVSSVNIKVVMMILMYFYALLWPYIRFVPKNIKSTKKIISPLDGRQCGNNLALCNFAVVMELPDSLYMNWKSEFGVIFLRCSPR